MRRLLLCLALAGCVARVDEAGDSDEPAVRWPLRRELNRAMEDLTLRGLLDSLPSRLARLPKQSVSLIVADTGARPAEIEAARRTLSVTWDRVTAGSDSLRLVLWFYQPVADTAEQSDSHPMTLHLPGNGFAGALMPELTDGRTCLVAIPVPPAWTWSEPRGINWGARRISPCAF